MLFRVCPGNILLICNTEHAVDFHFYAYNFITQDVVSRNKERAGRSCIIGITLLCYDVVSLIFQINIGIFSSVYIPLSDIGIPAATFRKGGTLYGQLFVALR